MLIKQFNDKGLAHFAYALVDETAREVILIDPARDPRPYYDLAAAHGARITHVIETHPHADFVSSHAEVAKATGATIHAHSLLGARYAHQTFDEGATLVFPEFTLRSLHTPGHSPDSITILLEVDGRIHAAFTGDTLFIGDVGRPDLRENVGNLTAGREALARQMYHSTRDKLMHLPDACLVYPAHGSGSLCGKALSDADVSTIGQEKLTNPALKPMSEDEFVAYLTADQPFIPNYFGYDVDLNRTGAPDFDAVARPSGGREGAVIVDARPAEAYTRGHLPGALNIQDGGKFETWLGSILKAGEPWYLVAESEQQIATLRAKAAKIGYELTLQGAEVDATVGAVALPDVDEAHFQAHPEAYTIVDVRNRGEAAARTVFATALNIPLPELRDRLAEIPTGKPVLVHCAAGYRSAAGSSIIREAVPGAVVYDLGERISRW